MLEHSVAGYSCKVWKYNRRNQSKLIYVRCSEADLSHMNKEIHNLSTGGTFLEDVTKSVLFLMSKRQGKPQMIKITCNSN